MKCFDVTSYIHHPMIIAISGCELEMLIELPNSALIVLSSLTSDGPMTPKTIISQIDLPSRTITFALRVLLKEKMVKRVPNFADMRQPFYHVNTGRIKELQHLFNVDQMTRFRPEIRQANHQGHIFNR
jgi:DNA-binding MarR family transcriptional regulator